jgi:hypothetical protein
MRTLRIALDVVSIILSIAAIIIIIAGWNKESEVIEVMDAQ